eukprot:CAMPEP_0174855988 /NCGR_PEP_ID=MMETSP1114-20130205/34772_1 /TAXON_ID=312471 /ORGANISM="Neobodo designis, Strain CCAP 1951/1" /LENGTH=372 /DNA_ID=CAMNT_0016090763 /DNA_START=128 /DNA_END=1246 /DNA_ORIENTATION=+
MGQLCSGGDDGGHVREGAGSSTKVVRGAAAAKFAYQLAGARRENQELPHQASRDPNDYQSSGLVGGTFVRLPGQINDQRINIDGGKDSVFLLLDHCDSVQVDECEGCTFYIGPTTGSVFLRGLVKCKVVVLGGQIRLRDCRDTDMALHTRSRPVIESSKNIGIGCFAGPQYLDLRWQLARASLSVYDNIYSAVHDFTPAPGNWHLLPPAQAAALIPSLEPLLPPGAAIDGEGDVARVVPVLHGGAHDERALRNGAVLLCRAGYQSETETLLWDVVQAEPSALLQAGEVRLTEDKAAALARAHPRLKGDVLRAKDVHVMLVLRGDSPVVAERLDEWCKRSEVLLGLPAGDTAANVRDVMLSTAGTDNGFGQAF